LYTIQLNPNYSREFQNSMQYQYTRALKGLAFFIQWVKVKKAYKNKMVPIDWTLKKVFSL